MKKQIQICALIAVLVLMAVGCASFTTETKYITNIAFITAVEEATDIDWTKEEDGTVRLTGSYPGCYGARPKLYGVDRPFRY